MKPSKSIPILIGIVLIILQILGFIGMSRMYVDLYPSMRDMSRPIAVSKSELNIDKILFAVEAGTDRFSSSFEDLTFPKDEYRIQTATQIASAGVRESLGCSDGGSLGLVVYDTVLTISYCFAGIFGVILIVFAEAFAKLTALRIR